MIAMFGPLIKVVTFLILASNRLSAVPISGKSNFELIILHNNDMHARFVQQNSANTDCNEQQAIDKKCFGGFARVAHIVRQHRATSENVLYLNAGDTYTGSPWFTLYKDNITSEMLNVLQPDAISLGNHEFDLGVAGLVPFLEKVDFPVLATNLDLSKTPSMQNLPSLKPSAVFTKAGRKVGVIGYLTPDTKKLVSAMTVDFFGEIESINKEAERLKSQEGVDIIIALGHSGIEEDQVIASSCPLVDVVVGGHSHTLLMSEESKFREKPYGPYPVVVTQKSGKKVPVVQSYAFTKYLGYLRLEFNDKGDLLSWDGQPLLLNDSVPRDPDVLQALDKYKSGVDKYSQTVVGYSKVNLDGDSCRFKECNMGNLVADAYVYIRSLQNLSSHWTDAAIGLVQGGGIRASINSRSSGNSSITRGELDTVLPFQNEVIVIEITGADLKEVLEFSVSRYNGIVGSPEFLQVSGIHVTFDLSKEPGKRIAFLKVLCADCDIPVYEEVIDSKDYKLMISDFLKNGGDGFKMFPSTKEVSRLNFIDIDTVQNYLIKQSPINQPIEGRVQLIGMANLLSTSATLVLMSILVSLRNLFS